VRFPAHGSSTTQTRAPSASRRRGAGEEPWPALDVRQVVTLAPREKGRQGSRHRIAQEKGVPLGRERPANSALLLRKLQDLSHSLRVHAVDILGHSALIADARPSVSNKDHGRWWEEVMEGLGLPGRDRLSSSYAE